MLKKEKNRNDLRVLVIPFFANSNLFRISDFDIRNSNVRLRR